MASDGAHTSTHAHTRTPKRAQGDLLAAKHELERELAKRQESLRDMVDTRRQIVEALDHRWAGLQPLCAFTCVYVCVCA